MAKRPRVQSLIQSVDPYRKDIFVCCGFTSMAQVKRRQPKGCHRWFLDWLDERAEKFDELSANDAHAFVMFQPRHGCAIIRLRPYSDSWDFWETLIHELHHYVEMLGNHCMFNDEMEAKAYLQEHLFHDIRRRLQGVH